MTNKFKLSLLASSLIAANAGLSLPAFAEDDLNFMLEEIVVTARRKDESLQDTPVSVSAVTEQTLKDLNITNFADLGAVVAGLSLEEDVIASSASLRGIKYEVLAQAPASVEFYMNESHATALQTMQKMFDVSQVEVLRGPQGTLRGRAAPSGAITVRTASAELDSFGGYIDATLSDDGDQNYQAAVNLPIIEDKLAIRVAGFWDESNLNDVSSAFGGGESDYEGNGYRFTLTAQPIDDLYINATYERIRPERTIFTPVESIAGAPASIKARDLKAVQDDPEESTQDIETTTLNIAWDINDSVALYYTGGYHSVVLEQFPSVDPTNAIDDTYPAELQNAVGYLYNDVDIINHEIRLQSIEPLFGKLDYVIGAFYEDQKSTVHFASATFVNDQVPDGAFGFIPGYVNGGTFVSSTDIFNYGNGNNSDTQENSYFINLTYHFTDDTELAVGARQIQYNDNSYLVLESTGTELQNVDTDEDHEIFTAVLTHHFNEDLMGYASWGTSWRAGPTLVGVFANSYSPTLRSFIEMPSETSDSYELGMKSTWMDGRLRVNAAIYRQEFENFAYRAQEGIYFDTDGFIAGPIGVYNLSAAVPVIVNGAELEVNFAATENLTLGALLAYAKGEIDGGAVPCNDYGQASGVAPTLAQIQAAVGSDQVASCTTDQQTNTDPDFTASLTAEYGFSIANLDAYVRGLYSYKGSSDNSPTNPLDDVGSYGILNLYAGLSDPSGVWSAMLYIKNVADTVKVVKRDADLASLTISNDQLGGFLAGSTLAESNYRAVQLTPEREIGINLRYNF